MPSQNFRVRNGLEVGTGVTISAGIISATSIVVSGNSASTFPQLIVSGVSTLGITTTTNLTAQQLNVSGVSTFSGITTFTGTTLFTKQLNVSGVITASSFSGSASNLTGLTGVSANTYGNATAVPQITVDSNGRITGISNVLISATGGGGTSLIVKNNGSLVGTAGTIDFGTGLNVSPVSAGIVTVTTNATSSNTVSTIVARDGSGNFSAGTVTATLSGNATSATTATTATTANALNTGNNYQVNSFGVGTAASGTAGEIRATNNITAYYSSDINLKTNIEPIGEPLKKLLDITGVRFEWTDECIKNRGGEDGYFVRKNDIGVIAQEIEKVLPEAVATREDGYKAVRYELLIPLLIESVKEQQKQIEELKSIIKEKL